MVEKQLNIERIRQAMTEAGLNAAAVATSLNVSKTIVSEWLKGKKFPRPRLLLSLGKLTRLSYSDIVIQAEVCEPVVAYRKHGNAKIHPEDEERAKNLGRAVELLVPYLPFNQLSAPARLISPRIDKAYIEAAAAEARKSMGIQEYIIRFDDVIRLFENLKAVLVPVLWGEKNNLDNALHVYLPKSETTWIYLNLDTKLFDFKFWMLHELAHTKTYGLLKGIAAEKFADEYAAAVLIPEDLAEAEYSALAKMSDIGHRIKHVENLGRQLIVSPITIAKRIDGLAESKGKSALLGEAVYPATANFNKEYKLVSKILFSSNTPKATDLIHISAEVFKSPIYPALRSWLCEHDASESMVSACLGINPIDAKAVFNALTSN